MAIGNPLKEEHDIAPDDIAQFFKILKNIWESLFFMSCNDRLLSGKN